MSDTQTAPVSTHEPAHPAYHVHVVPQRLLLAVFAALMFLTVLTVAVTYVDLGAANIWIALGVALVKATLVALFFMHLRWDSPFNAVILATALLFVVLFLSITLMDAYNYRPNLEPPGTITRPDVVAPPHVPQPQ